nr:DinB family protein [Paenibacillus hamazuiensis]
MCVLKTVPSDSHLPIAAVQAQWTDATLKEQRFMFGMFDWSVFETITAFVRHQAHHRGQLTVLMRQADLVVPGVYGPSKEELEAMSASR